MPGLSDEGPVVDQSNCSFLTDTTMVGPTATNPRMNSVGPLRE